MSMPANAKYCPRCATMNHADASICRHCGHQFRTGQAVPDAATSDAQLHRTQMFSLPPLPQRNTAESRQNQGEPRYLRAMLLAARSPLILAVGGIAVAMIALIVLAVKFDVFGR